MLKVWERWFSLPSRQVDEVLYTLFTGEACLPVPTLQGSQAQHAAYGSAILFE